MNQNFGISQELEKSISIALSSFKLDLNDSAELAKNVLQLSDYFINHPDEQTPWSKPFAQIAYLCYYLPLNTARLEKVIHEAAQRHFFEGLSHVIDFGAGLATASMAISNSSLNSSAIEISTTDSSTFDGSTFDGAPLNNLNRNDSIQIKPNLTASNLNEPKFDDSSHKITKLNESLCDKSKKISYTLVEKSLEPQKLIQNFFKSFQAQNPDWLRSFNPAQFAHSGINPKSTMALFSYSLTELQELPSWALDCEALFILEPSTQQDGRRLMQLREELLKKGFHVWAPCTHKENCPLLHQSKHDWCHDRVHFSAPTWFEKMEDHLPMKNKTLTMSYLLLRKTRPEIPKAARVVGDTLKEKGKNRQLICRGPEREFLAWMHKSGISQEIPRGALIEIPQSFQKVSNELRVTSDITEIG